MSEPAAVREPYCFGRAWAWRRVSAKLCRLPEDVPPDLFWKMRGGELSGRDAVRYYPTREAALAALADAERRAGEVKT